MMNSLQIFFFFANLINDRDNQEGKRREINRSALERWSGQFASIALGGAIPNLPSFAGKGNKPLKDHPLLISNIYIGI